MFFLNSLNLILCAASIAALDICIFVLIITAYCEKRSSKKNWHELAHDMELAEKDKIYDLGCDEVLIGRHASADIRLPDLSVSRYHAMLTVSNGIWTIKDIGSKSGIFVNGNLIHETVLHENDVIKLGNRRLIFRKRRQERVR
ncbi:FHA domain-containing protein [Ruminococcus flavefaciens]|uniref:FHA domain-containing protein n=1 Tax=Ruminococcus flavefaciens TaxID=1265 RepID=UPI001FA9402A|nr:FHA domain-containing protein [Ruminococcus flavefaciens]